MTHLFGIGPVAPEGESAVVADSNVEQPAARFTVSRTGAPRCSCTVNSSTGHPGSPPAGYELVAYVHVQRVSVLPVYSSNAHVVAMCANEVLCCCQQADASDTGTERTVRYLSFICVILQPRRYSHCYQSRHTRTPSLVLLSFCRGCYRLGAPLCS